MVREVVQLYTNGYYETKNELFNKCNAINQQFEQYLKEVHDVILDDVRHAMKDKRLSLDAGMTVNAPKTPGMCKSKRKKKTNAATAAAAAIMIDLDSPNTSIISTVTKTPSEVTGNSMVNKCRLDDVTPKATMTPNRTQSSFKGKRLRSLLEQHQNSSVVNTTPVRLTRSRLQQSSGSLCSSVKSTASARLTRSRIRSVQEEEAETPTNSAPANSTMLQPSTPVASFGGNITIIESTQTTVKKKARFEEEIVVSSPIGPIVTSGTPTINTATASSQRDPGEWTLSTGKRKKSKTPSEECSPGSAPPNKLPTTPARSPEPTPVVPSTPVDSSTPGTMETPGTAPMGTPSVTHMGTPGPVSKLLSRLQTSTHQPSPAPVATPRGAEPNLLSLTGTIGEGSLIPSPVDGGDVEKTPDIVSYNSVPITRTPRQIRVPVIENTIDEEDMEKSSGEQEVMPIIEEEEEEEDKKEKEKEEELFPEENEEDEQKTEEKEGNEQKTEKEEEEVGENEKETSSKMELDNPARDEAVEEMDGGELKVEKVVHAEEEVGEIEKVGEKEDERDEEREDDMEISIRMEDVSMVVEENPPLSEAGLEKRLSEAISDNLVEENIGDESNELFESADEDAEKSLVEDAEKSLVEDAEKIMVEEAEKSLVEDEDAAAVVTAPLQEVSSESKEKVKEEEENGKEEEKKAVEAMEEEEEKVEEEEEEEEKEEKEVEIRQTRQTRSSKKSADTTDEPAEKVVRETRSSRNNKKSAPPPSDSDSEELFLTPEKSDPSLPKQGTVKKMVTRYESPVKETTPLPPHEVSKREREIESESESEEKTSSMDESRHQKKRMKDNTGVSRNPPNLMTSVFSLVNKPTVVVKSAKELEAEKKAAALKRIEEKEAKSQQVLNKKKQRENELRLKRIEKEKRMRAAKQNKEDEAKKKKAELEKKMRLKEETSAKEREMAAKKEEEKRRRELKKQEQAELRRKEADKAREIKKKKIQEEAEERKVEALKRKQELEQQRVRELEKHRQEEEARLEEQRRVEEMEHQKRLKAEEERKKLEEERKKLEEEQKKKTPIRATPPRKLNTTETVGTLLLAETPPVRPPRTNKHHTSKIPTKNKQQDGETEHKTTVEQKPTVEKQTVVEKQRLAEKAGEDGEDAVLKSSNLFTPLGQKQKQEAVDSPGSAATSRIQSYMKNKLQNLGAGKSSRSTATRTTGSRLGAICEDNSRQLPAVPVYDPRDNYKIDDIESGDDTDDENKPKRTIPSWVRNKISLQKSLKQQFTGESRYKEKDIFGAYSQTADLDQLFGTCNRYKSRTSSAHWSAPPATGELDFSILTEDEINRANSIFQKYKAN